MPVNKDTRVGEMDIELTLLRIERQNVAGVILRQPEEIALAHGAPVDLVEYRQSTTAAKKCGNIRHHFDYIENTHAHHPNTRH
ncbi:hypothetical protein [Streptomyces sp. NPDC102264]|uniref:hypothetical protein n=1 Tax=Streptomyces sp. NPDC102264 TaxID=3366149 RepID=UPI00381F0E52